MKKYIISMAIPIILGCAVIFWPRPIKAEPAPIVSYSEEVITEIFDLVSQSENLRDELYKASPEIAEAALVESPNCLVCKAAALLRLRSYDENWADTLGECIDDDELDFCISYTLYSACHEVH
jgi:hypothetical protein